MRIVVITALALALVACRDRTVELGIDAQSVTLPTDASSCRCRITPCRTAGDCALIGGACGPDFYCVGDFGACSTTTMCQATATASVCVASATSTSVCQ